MIRKTLWRPDTCGCEMEILWDDEVEPRTTTITVAKHCPVHPGDEGVEENQRKNRGVGLIEQKSTIRGQDLIFSIDTDRNVILTLPLKISQAQYDSLSVQLLALHPKPRLVNG